MTKDEKMMMILLIFIMLEVALCSLNHLKKLNKIISANLPIYLLSKFPSVKLITIFLGLLGVLHGLLPECSPWHLVPSKSFHHLLMSNESRNFKSFTQRVVIVE